MSDTPITDEVERRCIIEDKDLGEVDHYMNMIMCLGKHARQLERELAPIKPGSYVDLDENGKPAWFRDVHVGDEPISPDNPYVKLRAITSEPEEDQSE